MVRGVGVFAFIGPTTIIQTALILLVQEKTFLNILKNMKNLFKNKKEPEIKASDITNGNMLVAAGVSKINVEIDDNEIIKGTWVKPEDEKPEKPGYYHVLTDDHLARGIAWYGEDLYADEVEEGVYDFFVEWAEYGDNEKPPKVCYWLKDCMWGLLYKFKKEKGEI
jgi:hypothetical protein